jgi:DNA-binding transcriptional LysR family regulator
VDVHLHEGLTEPLLTRLIDGRLDVATVRDPDPQTGIALRPLLDEPLVAVLPAGHPAAAGRRSIPAAALVDEPFVFFPGAAGSAAHDLGLRPVTDLGHRPHIAQEASSWTTMMHLVGAGFGVSIAPRSAGLARPASVRIVPFADAAIRSTLSVATRADDDRPIVRQLAALSPPPTSAPSVHAR